MALNQYTWPDTSLISSVRIEKKFLQSPAATVFLPPPSSDLIEKISKLLVDLPSRKVGVYLDTENEQPVMRLTSFGKKPEDLFSLLKEYNLLPDIPPHKESIKPEGEKKGIKAFILRHAMRINSAFSYIGQIGNIMRGFREMDVIREIKYESAQTPSEEAAVLRQQISQNGDKEKALQQIIQEYNNPANQALVPKFKISENSETLLKLVSNGISAKEFSSMMQGCRENVEIGFLNMVAILPRLLFGSGMDSVSYDKMADDSIKQIGLTRGNSVAVPWVNLEYKEQTTPQASAINLVRKYPIQIADSLSIVTGTRKMKTGIDLNKKGLGAKIVNAADFWQGLVVTLGSMLAVFMPETKKKQVADEQEVMGVEGGQGNKIVNFVKKHPLQIQSALSISANLGLVGDALKQKDPERRKFSLVTSLSFISSKIFNFLASKNSEKPDSLKPFEPLFARIANIVLEVPENQRAENVAAIAGVLSQQIRDQLGVVVDNLAEQVQQRIQEKAAELKQNPWFLHLKQNKALAVAYADAMRFPQNMTSSISNEKNVNKNQSLEQAPLQQLQFASANAQSAADKAV